MKKIMAFAAALVMALSTASCGSKTEDNSKTEAQTTTEAAATTAQADTASEEDAETTAASEAADESSEADTSKADDGASFDEPFKASEKNVFLFYNAPEYEPTVDEMIPLVDLIYQHYEAARTQDWKAYLDTVNYGGLISAQSFKDLAAYSNDQVDDLTPGIHMAVHYVFYGLVCNYAQEKYGDEYKDDTLADFIDSVTKAWDEISDEEAQLMVEKGFGLYRDLFGYDEYFERIDKSFFDDRDSYKLGGDTVFNVAIEECDKIGDDRYIWVNIEAFSNGKRISIPQTCCFKADGQYGVMSQVVKLSDTPYPGKTSNEIMEALENGDYGIEPEVEEEEIAEGEEAADPVAEETVEDTEPQTEE